MIAKKSLNIFLELSIYLYMILYSLLKLLILLFIKIELLSEDVINITFLFRDNWTSSVVEL
jgi:hypothetical protein